MNPTFELDVPTIFIALIVVNLAMGLALLAAMRGRFRYGLNYFAALFLLQPVTQLLFLFRGILPDFITIVIANSLLSVTYNMAYIGYCKFFNRQINWWLAILPVAITIIIFSIFINDFNTRVISSGIIFGTQYIIQFLLVLSIQENAVERSKPILLSAYGLVSLAFYIRAGYMLLFPGRVTGLFDPFIINSATLFATVVATVIIALGILLMLSDRLLEENRELATRDYLTHIFNRRTFNDLASRELARAERYNHMTSLLMVDIDRFKKVNDTYGHPVGDEVLIHLVQLFRNSLRMQDIYARYGGEEFCILLAETSSEEAFQIAERLRERIAASSLQTHGYSIKFTVSIGVVTSSGEQKPTLESLINAADIALYQAKEAGRNCTRTLIQTATGQEINQPQIA